MENIVTKTTGDDLTAAEWNQVPSELENSITDTGQALSGANLNQVSTAMSIYAAGGGFYTDSGAVNAYVLSTIGSKRAPVAYFDGMGIAFRAGTPNTAGSTVNVAGLGVKSFRNAGVAVVSGDILSSNITTAVYNSGTGFFDLTSKIADGAGSGLDADLLDGAQGALYARLIAPAFTGNPTAPTQLPASNSTRLATTEYVTLRNPRSGSVVQVVNVQDGAVNTGIVTFPNDNTIPQQTEGDEYMTLAITPTSATNKLKIEVSAQCSSSNTDQTMQGGLFQDGTLNALAAGAAAKALAGTARSHVAFTHFMTAGTTSSTTFKVRLGTSNAGTTTFNGSGGTGRYGGRSASSITITEIEV